VLQERRCRSEGLIAQLPEPVEGLPADDQLIPGVEEVILRFFQAGAGDAGELERAMRVK
jgi:hypothetical protein